MTLELDMVKHTIILFHVFQHTILATSVFCPQKCDSAVRLVLISCIQIALVRGSDNLSIKSAMQVTLLPVSDQMYLP